MYASYWLNIPTFVVGTLPLENHCDRYLSLGTMVFCTMCRTVRTERASRHQEIREGSDYNLGDDEDLRSEIASDAYFQMVQQEADMYMNSPGPGSD